MRIKAHVKEFEKELLEKQLLGNRLRTRSPTVTDDVSKRRKIEEKSLKGKSHMMELDETSLEEKLLDKRLRTSSSTLADDVSKRKKMMDESKPPTEN